MERLNPFLSGNFTVPYILFIKRDVSDYKIMEHGLEQGDWYEVESEKYTRVYRKSELSSIYLKLSKPALQLLCWIIFKLPEDAQSIKLDELLLMKEFDCCEKTVSRMKTELIRWAVIAKRDTNRFWINPRYFICGDRLKMFPEHKVKILTKKDGGSNFNNIDH